MKIRILSKILITSLVFSLIFFLSAGKLHFSQGWIFLFTNVMSALMNFWTIRNNPELMEERSKVGEGAKRWDKAILGISALIYVGNVVIAGLDSGRYQWSPVFPTYYYAVGILLTLIGQAIFLTARNENHFFSSVVRIQNDRGHKVCDTGIYKIVRHPGYLGMIISHLGFPLITGSTYSLPGTLLAIILLIIRTYLEDQTLQKELTGYKEYTQKTPKRLFPFIW